MRFNLPKLTMDPIKSFSKKFFQDRYEKVLSDLLDIETENPDDMRIKQKIAEIYFKKGEVEQAVEKYKEIASYYEKEDFVLKAIAACKSILKIKPELVDYNLKLSALFLKLGMTNEAANQYRIAINHYAFLGENDKTVRLSQDLVKIDPSPENRSKLAEIYQSFGMVSEAIKQYEILTKIYRDKKEYDRLLYYYELLLPHKQDNKNLIKDVCILNLRKQNPIRAIKVIEQFQITDDPVFKDLLQKAKMMLEMLKRQKVKKTSA